VDDLAERPAASSAAPIPGVAKGDLTDDDVARHFGVDLWPTSDLPAEAESNGHVPDDSWATTPGAWTNAPAAPTFEAEEPAPTVGGFVGVDGFVYETKEQADKVAATMLAEAAAAHAAAAQAAAELEAAQAAQAAEEALAAQATPVEPDATWVAAELAAEPATADAPPEPVQAIEPEPEPVAEAVEAEPPLHVVAWDEDASLEPEPEPIVAEAEPASVPEPNAASSEAEPEAPTPTTRIAPISETILPFPTRPVERDAAQPVAAEDESPEVAARRAQLDLLGLDGAEQPEMPAVIPYRSRGAAITPAELALRAAAGQRFWEASAREVASAVGNVGVQNCGECGLSLSANARFCRRCGTRQAQSA
jgi:ribosomal protein L40E